MSIYESFKNAGKKLLIVSGLAAIALTGSGCPWDISPECSIEGEIINEDYTLAKDYLNNSTYYPLIIRTNDGKEKVIKVIRDKEIYKQLLKQGDKVKITLEGNCDNTILSLDRYNENIEKLVE